MAFDMLEPSLEVLLYNSTRTSEHHFTKNSLKETYAQKTTLKETYVYYKQSMTIIISIQS